MRKTRAKYILAVLSLLGAACLASCSAKQQNAGSKGYDTPEKAVTAYLDGLKNMDLEQMMGTFAVDTYVDHYDFEGSLDRTRAYMHGLEIKFPNVTALARDLNVESRKTDISTSILRQYMSLASLDFSPMDSKTLKTEADVKEFTDKFTRKLKETKTDSIKLLGFIPPEELSELYASDSTKKNIARLTAIYGADELVCRAAVFEMDGKNYLICIDGVNYGGKWYLAKLGGIIGTLLEADPADGGLIPLSETDIDWAALIK